VSVEQTTNIAGGRVWPLEQVRASWTSRRPRAAPAPRRRAADERRRRRRRARAGDGRGFDTAWIDFTKGLGAPVGACLAGSRELIDEAWRYKQMLGGAMRQAGIVAAGALWALDHHVSASPRITRTPAASPRGSPRCRGSTSTRERGDEHRRVLGAPTRRGSARGLLDAGARMGRWTTTPCGRSRHLDVDAARIEAALLAARSAVAG
jgi:threonine aldolase